MPLIRPAITESPYSWILSSRRNCFYLFKGIAEPSTSKKPWRRYAVSLSGWLAHIQFPIGHTDSLRKLSCSQRTLCSGYRSLVRTLSFVKVLVKCASQSFIRGTITSSSGTQNRVGGSCCFRTAGKLDAVEVVEGW